MSKNKRKTESKPKETVIWSRFVYDYKFNLDFGWKVKVNIDYMFKNVSDMEIISRFPHAQRRSFAKHCLDNFEEGKYHQLAPTDIFNPFAKQLEKLFETGIDIYWVRRPTDTMLFVTGYSKYPVEVVRKTVSATVRRVLLAATYNCGSQQFRRLENQFKSYLGSFAERPAKEAIPATN